LATRLVVVLGLVCLVGSVLRCPVEALLRTLRLRRLVRSIILFLLRLLS
jgi:hypothetical protein